VAPTFQAASISIIGDAHGISTQSDPASTSVTRRVVRYDLWGMIAFMWERHGWVFDLVSADEVRRRQARTRSRRSVEALLAPTARVTRCTGVRAGSGHRPTPALAAAMAGAQAAYTWAFSETFYAPITAYLQCAWEGPDDAKAQTEPFAVLFLQWEAAYPKEWACEAARWDLDMGGRRRSSRRCTDTGRRTTPCGRSNGWCFRRSVARTGPRTGVTRESPGNPDTARLREALGSIAADNEEAASLRARYVLSRLEQPGLSVNRRSYGNWLRQHATP
jgi:hypothetical protein